MSKNGGSYPSGKNKEDALAHVKMKCWLDANPNGIIPEDKDPVDSTNVSVD